MKMFEERSKQPLENMTNSWPWLSWFGHLSSGLAKTILEGTVKGKRRKEDRRRDGKKMLRSGGKGWDLLAQLGQLKTELGGKGIVVKSSVVLQGPRKVMG